MLSDKNIDILVLVNPASGMYIIPESEAPGMLKGIRKDRTWIPATILVAGIIFSTCMHWTGWLFALTMIGYIVVGTLLILSPKLLLITILVAIVSGFVFWVFAAQSWLGLLGIAFLLLILFVGIKLILEVFGPGGTAQAIPHHQRSRSTSS